jgi:hypothetical protein
MKKCKDCGKIVFACCGNEPGNYCYRCEEKMVGDEKGKSPAKAEGDEA